MTEYRKCLKFSGKEMNKRFFLPIGLSIALLPNIASAKDMAGTMIKCSAYNSYSYKQKKTMPAATNIQYIAISKDQNYYCKDNSSTVCSNFNNFSKFGARNNSQVDSDYYYLMKTDSLKVELPRDGTYLNVYGDYNSADGIKVYFQCNWYKDLSF